METRKTQNAIGATVNELAAFIRENAPIKFGEVCLKKKIAPSTLHGYVRVMLDVCEDIHFSHGLFTLNNKQARAGSNPAREEK
jgi:hypothetical protein